MALRGHIDDGDRAFDRDHLSHMRSGVWYKRGYQVKEPVVSLIEGGKVRSTHIPEVNSKTLKPVLREQISKGAMVFTDDARYYGWVGREFKGGHYTVNHSIKEYVRGGATVNACENYFSILKRGLNGVYQHCSPKHLKRYVGEFDLRYNTRKLADIDRAKLVAKGSKGKRLTYRRAGSGQTAETLHGA